MTASVSVVCSVILAAVGLDEPYPRLSEEYVGRLADAKVRIAGYIPEAYRRSSPVYVRANRVWLMDYDPIQKQGSLSRAFTVNVDDTTESASLTFDPPRTAVAERRSRLFEIFNSLYAVGTAIGLVIAFVCWLCGRPVRRFRR